MTQETLRKAKLLEFSVRARILRDSVKIAEEFYENFDVGRLLVFLPEEDLAFKRYFAAYMALSNPNQNGRATHAARQELVTQGDEAFDAWQKSFGREHGTKSTMKRHANLLSAAYLKYKLSPLAQWEVVNSLLAKARKERLRYLEDQPK